LAETDGDEADARALLGAPPPARGPSKAGSKAR
jgi:hypothetical protein